MGQAAIPLLLVSSVLDGVGKERAGNAAKAESKFRIRQAKTEGKDAQIRRNDELIDELARRNVLRGAGVGTGQGDKRSLEDFDMDSSIIATKTKVNTEALKRQGRNAKKSGRMGALGAITKGAFNASLIDG